MDIQENKTGGLSGSTLKLIAIVTMLIDHVGAALVYRMMLAYIDRGGAENTSVYGRMLIIYWVMRMIGRIAFPIFCFLMVEGFQKTHNKWKYAMRLGGFALLSEIPFDLAFNSRVLRGFRLE